MAPEREQSGVGASLTLRSPLRVTPAPVDPSVSEDCELPHPITAFSVDGTPGDCSILALENLVGPVDLVVSGINSGSNLGWDVMVSGTVGAAVQGYVRGYRTIAISVGAVSNPHFDGASRLLRLMANRLNGSPTETNFLLNINVPSLPLAQIGGVRVTQLGNRSYAESVREENVGSDKKYWISRNRPVAGEPLDGTDIWAAKKNLISITPLQINLGHQSQIAEIETLLADILNQLLDGRA